MPPVLREFRYFETAADAIRAALAVPRERQAGSFLVQFGRKYDMGDLRRMGARPARPAQAGGELARARA